MNLYSLLVYKAKGYTRSQSELEAIAFLGALFTFIYKVVSSAIDAML